MTGYACKHCGAPAAVSPEGEITRACTHAGTVVASMSAVAYGRGGMREANPIVAFLRRIGIALMRRA